jgi:hypothetical protein
MFQFLLNFFRKADNNTQQARDERNQSTSDYRPTDYRKLREEEEKKWLERFINEGAKKE